VSAIYIANRVTDENTSSRKVLLRICYLAAFPLALQIIDGETGEILAPKKWNAPIRIVCPKAFWSFHSSFLVISRFTKGNLIILYRFNIIWMEKVVSIYGAHANTWKASAHFKWHLLVEKKWFFTVLLDVSCFFFY
jgi:hypothetical protein